MCVVHIYVHMKVICYYENFILQLFPHRTCVTLPLLPGFELRVQDDEEWPRRNFGQSLVYFNVVYFFILLFLL